MKNPLVISNVSLFPVRGTSRFSSSVKSHVNGNQLCAKVEVILNDTLILRGLKVLRGHFGYYVSFPHSHRGVAYKLYESTSMKFRSLLQNKILKEYQQKQEMSLYIHGRSKNMFKQKEREEVC